jgi:hypothetical protein
MRPYAKIIVEGTGDQWKAWFNDASNNRISRDNSTPTRVYSVSVASESLRLRFVALRVPLVKGFAGSLRIAFSAILATDLTFSSDMIMASLVKQENVKLALS